MNQRTSLVRLVTIGSAMLLINGCGGASGSGLFAGGDGGSEDGRATNPDAAPDAAQEAGDAGPPPATGPFACGTKTCGKTQYCVHPCCGGVAPTCEPLSSLGCPPGTHEGTCPNGGPGCISDPCTPPPPRCVDDPKRDAPDCSASPSTPRDLSCVCA